MATISKEFESYYKAGYLKLLDEVKMCRGNVSDDAFNVLARVADNYRDWAILLGGLDFLPEVPKENKL